MSRISHWNHLVLALHWPKILLELPTDEISCVWGGNRLNFVLFTMSVKSSDPLFLKACVLPKPRCEIYSHIPMWVVLLRVFIPMWVVLLRVLPAVLLRVLPTVLFGVFYPVTSL